jgi:transcriptional regulator with XRE-family HTH domain
MARRLNVEVMDIRRQENPATDVPLSLLYKWQKALGVPVTELLVESEDGLSEALLRRAQLIRIMKTARAVHEQAEDEELRSMTQTLIDELIEIMPELREIAAWHTVGKRRGPRELGAAVGRGYVGEIYGDLE